MEIQVFQKKKYVVVTCNIFIYFSNIILCYIFSFFILYIHIIQALKSATPGPDTPHNTIVLIKQFKFNNFSYYTYYHNS